VNQKIDPLKVVNILPEVLIGHIYERKIIKAEKKTLLILFFLDLKKNFTESLKILKINARKRPNPISPVSANNSRI
jgi:hypothetical protein